MNILYSIWEKISKVIRVYGPYALQWIIDRIIDLILFLKRQIVYALQQIFRA